MKFLEKNLEEIVFETDSPLILDRGLLSYDNFDSKYRQMQLGGYGISDIVTFKFNHHLQIVQVTVYELKQEQVNAGTLLQAIGYCKGISLLLGESPHLPEGWSMDFRIVLVGSKIDKGSNFCYLSDFMPPVSVYTYSYEFDGIHFKLEHSYSLTNNSFPASSRAQINDIIDFGLMDRDARIKKILQDEKDSEPF